MKECLKKEKKLASHKGNLQKTFFCISVKESIIDPLGQPTVTAGSDHYFRTCCPSVRPFVRPHFSDLAKQDNRNNGRYW